MPAISEYYAYPSSSSANVLQGVSDAWAPPKGDEELWGEEAFEPLPTQDREEQEQEEPEQAPFSDCDGDEDGEGEEDGGPLVTEFSVERTELVQSQDSGAAGGGLPVRVRRRLVYSPLSAPGAATPPAPKAPPSPASPIRSKTGSRHSFGRRSSGDSLGLPADVSDLDISLVPTPDFSPQRDEKLNLSSIQTYHASEFYNERGETKKYDARRSPDRGDFLPQVPSARYAPRGGQPASRSASSSSYASRGGPLPSPSVAACAPEGDFRDAAPRRQRQQQQQAPGALCQGDAPCLEEDEEDAEDAEESETSSIHRSRRSSAPGRPLYAPDGVRRSLPPGGPTGLPMTVVRSGLGPPPHGATAQDKLATASAASLPPCGSQQAIRGFQVAPQMQAFPPALPQSQPAPRAPFRPEGVTCYFRPPGVPTAPRGTNGRCPSGPLVDPHPPIAPFPPRTVKSPPGPPPPPASAPLPTHGRTQYMRPPGIPSSPVGFARAVPGPFMRTQSLGAPPPFMSSGPPGTLQVSAPLTSKEGEVPRFIHIRVDRVPPAGSPAPLAACASGPFAAPGLPFRSLPPPSALQQVPSYGLPPARSIPGPFQPFAPRVHPPGARTGAPPLSARRPQPPPQAPPSPPPCSNPYQVS